MEHIMKKYFDELVQSTAEIIRFDSSMKAPEGENGEYPFGKENADCLAFFLTLAEEMGFETHNYDNFVGEVVFGKGEDFAVLAHLDVVPAGSGWNYPPFGGVINDGTYTFHETSVDIQYGGKSQKLSYDHGILTLKLDYNDQTTAYMFTKVIN